jgi:hypothetical protein
MSKTYILIPDQHAHPDYHNDRADWAGKLIADVKPDVVVNMGDAIDLASLSSYDKGTRAFVGRSYLKDLNSHLDFQERLWAPMKRLKKKMPHSIYLEGNHEHRVERALDLSPELTGTIGFKDFAFDDYYNVVQRYEGGTPGVFQLDDILFAHYFVTGVSGRPIGGERAAHMHLAKIGQSAIAAHSHIFDYATRTNTVGRTTNGLVVGCYQDYSNDWAGNVANLWRRGMVILRNVEAGDYDVQWCSIEALKKEYS